MQGKHWLVVISMLVWAACEWKQPNPARCPGSSDCPKPGGYCETSAQCRAPTPVCDEPNTKCVECLMGTDCAATRPVCSTQNTCVQCEKHADCTSSGLCLLEGECAGPTEVIYVGGAGAVDNTTCSKAMPCLTLAHALTMAPLRKYIKVTGAVPSGAVVTIDGKSVDIYGDAGAQISRSTIDEVLSIKGMGSPKVGLIDLEIIGNASPDKECVKIGETAEVTMTRVNVHNHGEIGVTLGMSAKLVMIESQVHDMVQEGVKAAAGTTLELRRSSIYKNKGMAGVFTSGATMVTIDSSTIADNDGTIAGGVSITGPFRIRNSIISRNGNASSVTGGLALGSVDSVFEFNTVANNVASGTAGISCANTIAITNSILTNNLIAPTCVITHSLIATSGPIVGTNITGEPMFLDISGAPMNPRFFRIGEMSAARNAADPEAMLDVDIDGDLRSDPQDRRKDMGADEFRGMP